MIMAGLWGGGVCFSIKQLIIVALYERMRMRIGMVGKREVQRAIS